MNRTPPISASPAAPPIAFLVELDNTWSACRLYDKSHPAFVQRAQAAAAALDRPLRVSISSRGFNTETSPVENDNLRDLARRLRAMGLVGLEVQPPITAGQVAALVVALDECDRHHAAGEPVAARIAAASGQRVRAALLKVDRLRLVAGTSRPAAGVKEDPATVVIDFFFQRLGGGGSGGGGGAGDAAGGDGKDGAAQAAHLARTFESALRGVGSDADWTVVIEAWNQGLLSIDPRGADGTDWGTHAEAVQRLEEVAAFLRSLSPMLCRRLLSGTVNGTATPASLALALAERLPLGIVLGALSEVDRSSASPSAAAVAVLRKIAANVTTGHSAALEATAAALQSNAQLAEVAVMLQRLLGATHEEKFVPSDYFNRRQELSATSVTPESPASAAAARALVIPSEEQTNAHAAALAFHILTQEDSEPIHIVSGLEFLKNHLGDWVRGGRFSLAEQGLEHAQRLRTSHPDAKVVEAAEALLSAETLDADVLMEGSRHSADRGRAVADISKLLGQNDGAALVSLLLSDRVPESSGGKDGGRRGGENVVLEAVRRYLPAAPEGWIVRLFGAGQTKIPTGLARVLESMNDADVFKVVGAILPHAVTAARRALVEAIFRRRGRWPIPLIERLLKDAEPGVRRLAVMRLIRDADLATAAGFLRDASDPSPYAVDVAVGLSDLLHPHRRHADVRSAYRKWFWSRRRWAGFFSFSISLDHGRRAA